MQDTSQSWSDAGEETLAPIARLGHVVYESGDHGDTWLALDLLLADPARLRVAAQRLAAAVRPFAPAVICGPLTGGAFVGLLVAEELGTPFVPSERRRTPASPLRYDLPSPLRPIVHGARVVIVDDAVNASAATLASRDAIAAAGGHVTGVGALFARDPGAAARLADHGLPLVALTGLPFALWPPAACPLCAAGVPLDAPD